MRSAAWRLSLGWLLCLAATACGDARPAEDAPLAASSGSRSAPASSPAPSARPRVVVLGDSIAAGLGLPAGEAFPAVLQRRIDAARLDYQVVNAGLSGDTTAGGLRRLDWALEGDVRVLVLELGANDGLRGLSVDEMSRNLGLMIDRATSRGVRVVLCGMEAPPNFGPEYTQAFRDVYARLARRPDVRLIPFVLAGVAGDPALNQADGIHPNAAGARRVADLVWPVLQPLLTSAATS